MFSISYVFSSKKSINNIIIISFVFIALFSLFIISELIFINNTDQISKPIKNDDRCLLHYSDVLTIEGKNLYFKYSDIYLNPDIENVFCLGRVTNLNELDFSSNDLFINVGSNPYIKYIFFLFNLIFFFKFYVSKENTHIFIFVTFLIFKYLLFKYYFFDFEYQNYLFPFFELSPAERYLGKFFVFDSLILMFVTYKSQNNYLLLGSFIYFLFFGIDFFGLYLICIFLKNGFKFNFNLLQQKIFFSLPIMFFSIRFISGLSDKLNLLWISGGMSIYHGFGRYDDLRKNLLLHKCVVAKTEGCFEGGGGPLDSIIKYYGDPKSVSLYVGSLTIILIILIYSFLIIKIPTNKELICIFFLSLPFNFMTFLMAPDIYFVFIGITAIIYYKNYPKISRLIIFLLSAYKLHPAGLLLGLLFYNLKFNKKRIFLDIVFLTTLFSWVLYDRFANEAFIVTGVNKVFTYGILNDAIYINRIFGVNKNIVSLLIFLGIIVLSFSKYFEELYSQLNFTDKLDIKKSVLIPYIIWFLVCVLYSNHMYRFAMFLPLLYFMYIGSSSKIKLLIILSICLNPAITQFPEYLQYVFLNIHSIVIYLLAILFGKYIIKNVLFEDRIKNTFQKPPK